MEEYFIIWLILFDCIDLVSISIEFQILLMMQYAHMMTQWILRESLFEWGENNRNNSA